MKTRLLIIFGITAVIGTVIILGANMMMESTNQHEMELNQSHLAWDAIPNPVCFEDMTTSGQTGGAIAMGSCYPLSDFESMGCTKPMLDHLYEHSNVLAPEYSGAIYLDFIGLPDYMSQEKFDECFENLSEFRISLHSESLSEPEPEPGPMPESDSLQRQKQQQAKLHVQETIMTDYRGNEHQIKAIDEYRNEFEPGYFLEQFILFTNNQNYEKDDLINFVFVEWGYQPEECTSTKVEVYLRPYENYDSIEKISEWQKPDEECIAIDSDSDGYLIMNVWPMPGVFEPHETCSIPGEYRIIASNLEDESKKEHGYYTCQQEKLVGEPQPWMELPS